MKWIGRLKSFFYAIKRRGREGWICSWRSYEVSWRRGWDVKWWVDGWDCWKYFG